MDRNLELLIQIQALDIEIYKIDELIKAIPGQIEGIEKEFSASQKELISAKEHQAKLQKELKSKEIDVEAERQKMLKTQHTLLQVKTNKEYAAALAEIETAKSKVTVLEDNILEMMGQIEDYKVAIANKTKILEQKDKERGAKLKKKQDERRRFESELSSIVEKREELSALLDKDAIELYLKIRDSRKGLAVVPVKDNACQGCFLLVTPQRVQEVRTNEKLIHCIHCNRILFWPLEQEKSDVTA